MLNFFKSNLETELLKCLEKIQYGSIEVILPSGQIRKFVGDHSEPDCFLKVKSEKFFSYLLDKGDIGLGEAYIENLWEANNISDIIHFGILNKHALAKAIYGQSAALIYYKLKHLFKRNSKEGSRKNISFHYDLGNDFYRIWLDKSMTYSSAYWGTEKHLNLQEAQQKKYQSVLMKLGAKPGARILEVGCGWGGFAEFAASQGFHVTGLTLSKEQLNYAQQRFLGKSYPGTANFLLHDYREHQAQYDHVVSIEMIEAVGEAYWDIYFQKLKSFLIPGGSLAIQSILIQQEAFSDYRKGTDFIQQYIFPGGMLPTLNAIQEYLRKNGFQGINHIDFGLDYARTLKEWDQVFTSNLTAFKELGYGEDFLRMWHFYLNYCEGAFVSGQIDVSIISAKI